jgi:hypothetical protein
MNMTKQKSAHILIGAMNLLAVASPLLTSQVSKAAIHDQKVEKLNRASLKSLESTWIKVPHSCKARGFNASPVSLQSHTVSSHIQTIYASFGA